MMTMMLEMVMTNNNNAIINSQGWENNKNDDNIKDNNNTTINNQGWGDNNGDNSNDEDKRERDGARTTTTRERWMTTTDNKPTINK